MYSLKSSLADMIRFAISDWLKSKFLKDFPPQ